MTYPNKQEIIADAHRNPEYAAMSARKLARIIDVSQPVISKWRRENFGKPVCEVEFDISKPKRKLPAKVTVASVRRRWEEKYAALNRQYEWLAKQHIGLAKKADAHRNNEKALRLEISLLNEKIDNAEKKSWIQRLFNSKA